MTDVAPDEEQASAVLDSAHLGDIQGAFGTIKQHYVGSRRSWKAIPRRVLEAGSSRHKRSNSATE